MQAAANQPRQASEPHPQESDPAPFSGAGGTPPSVTIARRYTVDLSKPYGQGGMALVYRGRDLKTRRDVAIKTLRTEYRDNPENWAKFRQEIRRMAFLDHPNVAQVYDLIDEGGAPWAAIEFVEGPSLKDIVLERGVLPPEDVADLLDQIAAALDYVHKQKLVHLDVKPQNLLRTPSGVVKLIDFGLAQPAGSTQELIGGTTFGTAAYLSPEQASGDPVSRSADIYSLGCVVYELLTGQPPFVAESESQIKNDVIRAHIERQPEPPSRARPDLHLTPSIDEVVLWALAKAPSERFSDAITFANIFRGAVDAIAAERGYAPIPIGLDDVPWGAPAKSPPPVVAPTRVQQGSAAHRPIGGQAYRIGGRAARRTGWLRRGLWRLIAVLALANALLGLGVLARFGPDGLIGQSPSLQAGSTARVSVDELLVRADAGTDADAIVVLSDGAEIELTGEPTVVDGIAWWPIETDQGGETISGYVWSGGISPSDGPGVFGGIRDLIGRLS